MTEIVPFLDAIDDANRECETLTILLGNGFSIDYDSSIFSYASLAQEAELAGLSVPKKELFSRLGSENFEVIVEKLNSASGIQSLYHGDRSVAERMSADADVVRFGLADALAARHPRNSRTLTNDEVRHAREFLTHFTDIYSLSYDLLLYWVVNRDTVGPFVRATDGFEWQTRDGGKRLVWKRNPSGSTQHVHFLHGALHFFVDDRRLTKLNYRAHGSLVGALRGFLAEGDYPLVVTEGTRSEKEARIERSAYLRTALRRFGSLKGALFVHGVSMSPNDDHVLELVEAETSEITALYVGVHGREGEPDARKVIGRAKEIARHRGENGSVPLRLVFYDAASANVWRS